MTAELTLVFTDFGESTKITLAQGPFATEERLELRDGWTDSLERLTARL